MGNSKNNNFGYIGQELPTINAAGTSGIFNNADINYLKSRDEYPGVILVDFLVIAGGAGGYGGGGGAGGYRNSYAGETSGGNNTGGEGALAIAPNQVLTVELGSGGAAKFSGNDSTFGSIVSDGGGRGGPTNQNGTDGGSGGGCGGSSGGSDGGAGTVNQGFDGGDKLHTASPHAAAGGGGAGAIGGNTRSASLGGHGGAGLSSSITGSAVTRAGGGGGSIYYSGGSPGSGGSGGGGAGLANSFHGGGTGGAGSVNTGSGGGGGSNGAGTAGAGGSGVIIIRYPAIFTMTDITSSLTDSTSTSGDFKITTITAGTGTVSFA